MFSIKITKKFKTIKISNCDDWNKKEKSHFSEHRKAGCAARKCFSSATLTVEMITMQALPSI